MTITRFAYITLFALAAATGCNSLKHSDGRLEAQKRWSHTRGRVKYALAEQQYEAGLFDEAINTIAESIALHPDQPDAYALLARADLELGKPASAQRALDAAERRGLTTPELAYLQGVILEQRGKLEAAMESFARARELDPANVDYLVAEAESLVALDRPEEALELLDKYADRVDDAGTVSASAAHVSTLLGNVEGAIRRLSRALIAQAAAVSPGVPIAGARTAGARIPSRTSPERSDMATTLHPLPEDIAGARIPSRTSPEWSGMGTPPHPLPEDRRLIMEELGRMLLHARRYDEALLVLRPLLASARGDREDGLVVRAAATCHLVLGEAASALDILAGYAPNHPDDALAQLLLAKAAVAENDIVTALQAIDRAERYRPDHPELRFVRAVVNWKRGRLAAAAADLYDVLQNDPDDVDAHCLLGEVLRAQKRIQAARTHFQRALGLDPHCAWAAAGLEGMKHNPASQPVGVPAKLTAAATLNAGVAPR